MDDHEPLVFFRDDPNPLAFGMAIGRMLMDRGFEPESAAKALVFVAQTLAAIRLPGILRDRALALRLRGTSDRMAVMFAGDGEDVLIAPSPPEELVGPQGAPHAAGLDWVKKNCVVRAPGGAVAKWAQATISGSLP